LHTQRCSWIFYDSKALTPYINVANETMVTLLLIYGL
jgi:hypothetical protein